jgi:N-acetylglucosaminyl-diphospho-decaprenol L-rhamnosyltransferase
MVLTAVVVHRSRPDACVQTGRRLLDEGVDRLVVVDNGSSADDLRTVRAGLPEAEVLEQGVNRGFGPGANVGMRFWLDHGTGEWVLLAPHDAQPDPGSVKLLVDAAAERPRAGLACAEFGVDHPINSRPWVNSVVGGVLAPSERRPGWEPCDYPHGTLMLANRKCLDDIGLFDERYFAYCEETDLGIRARAAGWEVGIVWGSVVRNPSMSSGTGVPEYLMLRNSLHLVRWHFGRKEAALQWLMAAWITLRGGLGGRRPIFFDTRGRVLALRDFLLGRVGPPPASLTTATRSS